MNVRNRRPGKARRLLGGAGRGHTSKCETRQDFERFPRQNGSKADVSRSAEPGVLALGFEQREVIVAKSWQWIKAYAAQKIREAKKVKPRYASYRAKKSKKQAHAGLLCHEMREVIL